VDKVLHSDREDRDVVHMSRERETKLRSIRISGKHDIIAIRSNSAVNS